MESIVVAGGCFWCMDAAFRMVRGISSSVCGYAGGTAETANYNAVCSGNTGHAEAVQLHFDPAIISIDDILNIFWIIHNPTTKNRQGHDVGPQYRSAIFYNNQSQKQVADESMQRTQNLWDDPIVTELQPLQAFYPAEDYHQDYFAKNPAQGYCQIVINPMLQELRQAFKDKLR